MTMGERMSELRGAEWRGTESLEFDGPSTRTFHASFSERENG